METLVARQESEAELCKRIDILAVISHVVSLKPHHASGGTHKGLCPFHIEKAPSFHVHKQKGFFHCFGCGVGGNVIEFVMKFGAGCSYTQAVRLLSGPLEELKTDLDIAALGAPRFDMAPWNE